jgi:hypothetical protein
VLALLIAMAAAMTLLAAPGTALGITPVHSTADYVPGAEYRGSFTVLNPEGFNSINIYAESDIPLSFKSATITLGGKDGTVEYTLELPGERPPPGDHVIEIYVEPAEIATSGVTARVRLGHKLTITVPPEGPYLTATLDVREAGSNVVLESLVRNTGSATASLVAFFSLTPVNSYDQILNATTFPQTLDPGEAATINVSVPTDKVPHGLYNAYLDIGYNGNDINASRDWQFGQPRVTLRDMPSTAKANDLTQLTIGLHSDWNQPLQDVTAVLTLMDPQGITLRSISTETVNLPPMGDAVVQPVLDARGLSPQNTSVIVRINMKTGKQEIRQSLRLVNASEYMNVMPAAALQQESTLWLAAIILIALLAVVIIVVRHIGRREQ